MPVSFSRKCKARSGYIFDPFAQRRHVDPDDRQPIEQVRPEPACLDLVLQPLVRCGHNPHINLDLFPTHRPARTSPEASTRRSLACMLGRDLANLVEEEGSAVGGLETALFPTVRSSKGASLVAEQLAFEQTSH